MKSVCIRSCSGPYFPAFGLNNFEYGDFLRSDNHMSNKSYSQFLFWGGLIEGKGSIHLRRCFSRVAFGKHKTFTEKLENYKVHEKPVQVKRN